MSEKQENLKILFLRGKASSPHNITVSLWFLLAAFLANYKMRPANCNLFPGKALKQLRHIARQQKLA